MQACAKLSTFEYENKESEKEVTTLKDWVDHPFKRYFTEILEWVSNQTIFNFIFCSSQTLFWFFFQICCFLHWIQSVYPHLFCSLYDNGSPLYLSSASGLLCWWIFIVPEVVLNLVYLSIFSGLAALMSADIARNLWSLVCSCLNSYWTFHLFPLLIFFFKFVAFCNEFNLFTHICFVLFMIMDLLYICDHQVGYSAGGYSLSSRWFLTWYIYPFFQD